VNPGSHYITTKVKNTLNAMVNKVKECVLLKFGESQASCVLSLLGCLNPV